VPNWGCDNKINSNLRVRNGGRSGVFDGGNWSEADVEGPGTWELWDNRLGLGVDFGRRTDEIGRLEEAFEGCHPCIPDRVMHAFLGYSDTAEDVLGKLVHTLTA